MSDELNVQTNESSEVVSRTIELTIESNGLGINASQTFQSVTVDFAPIQVINNVSWSGIQDKPAIESGSGEMSVVIGDSNYATDLRTLAHGHETTASGNASHSEGINTSATGIYSHSEGNGTVAQGIASHAEGRGTVASNPYEHAEGSYNESHKNVDLFGDGGNTIFSIGIGDDPRRTKNAVEVMQNGDVYLYGVGDYDGTRLGDSYTLKYVIDSKVDGDRLYMILGFDPFSNEEEYQTGDYVFYQGQLFMFTKDHYGDWDWMDVEPVNFETVLMGVIDNKTDKVQGATAGNFAGLDSTGKLTDSGISASDIPTVPTISNNIATDKASTDKTASPKAVYDEIHPAVGSSQPSGGMLPNVLYNLGTLTGTVTLSMATAADSSIANHWYWTFDTSSTAPTITWPAAITSWFGGSAPTINASKHYEISVLGGIGVAMEV